MADQKLSLAFSSSPHLRSSDTVANAMQDVLLALCPVTLVSIFFFKLHAVFLILVCLAAAALTELVFRKAMNKPSSLHDGSALVTGLLVALCFGPATAWWTAALCTFIAVGIAKELMGGLGWNRFNPALFGRVSVIMLVPIFSYLSSIFVRLRPVLGTIDMVTQATPLALLKQGAGLPGLANLFVAFPGGALGETSALALILGGVYLLYKQHITWEIPGAMIIAVFVVALLFGQNPLYHVLSGGVLIGAFFMATDWVTSPITSKGKLIFGAAIGILLVVFRVGLGPTEGTAFSILIMNAFVPYIDRMTKRPKFGEVAAGQPAVTAGQPVSKTS
ncbi:MAG: RnfABCDGE type electron transport complex subunit D [Dethiobacteria bacterium]|jgi:electron transport complex protein RnfD